MTTASASIMQVLFQSQTHLVQVPARAQSKELPDYPVFLPLQQ